MAPDTRSPLEDQIRAAHDSVQREHWAPARFGIIPQFRIGSRWFSVLWFLPIGFVGLIAGIAVAHELRSFACINEFIAQYPGHSSSAVHYQSFPLWLRIQHAINLLFMMFIIRSGIQILADHPRLYWNKDCTPGTEWFRFQRGASRSPVDCER